MLAEARRERSAVRVLRGEAGIGKSALLEYAADNAEDCQLLRAAGAEWEMELPFAGLHQLCLGLLEGRARLPAPQSEALTTAFGLSSGPQPDRFLVGLAVLRARRPHRAPRSRAPGATPGDRGRTGLALCEQDEDRLGPQPPSNEREHLRRGSIKPLNIVDEADHGTVLRGVGQQAGTVRLSGPRARRTRGRSCVPGTIGGAHARPDTPRPPRARSRRHQAAGRRVPGGPETACQRARRADGRIGSGEAEAPARSDRAGSDARSGRVAAAPRRGQAARTS